MGGAVAVQYYKEGAAYVDGPVGVRADVLLASR